MVNFLQIFLRDERLCSHGCIGAAKTDKDAAGPMRGSARAHFTWLSALLDERDATGRSFALCGRNIQIWIIATRVHHWLADRPSRQQATCA